MEDSGAFRRPTQDEMGLDITSLFRGAVRLVIEHVLQDEVRELVGAQGRMKLLAIVKDPRSIARYLAAEGEPTESRAARQSAVPVREGPRASAAGAGRPGRAWSPRRSRRPAGLATPGTARVCARGGAVCTPLGACAPRRSTDTSTERATPAIGARRAAGAGSGPGKARKAPQG
jgi:hypothetical protein